MGLSRTGPLAAGFPGLAPTSGRARGLLWAGVLCVGVAIVWLTSHWARELATAEIRDRSGHTLNLVVENLRGELARHIYRPRLLSGAPEVIHAAAGRASAAELAELNLELERITDISGALDTYLMDRTGLTIAASNWDSPRTFIGNNFSYRPYFQAAMRGNLGRYFAVGTTSGERGYYFAYPVRDGAAVVGTIVVKMGVGDLEGDWRAPHHEILVVDDYGVIFLSSNADWLFRTLGPVSSAARAELAETRRYATEKLERLPVVARDGDDTISIRRTVASSSGNERRSIVTTYAVERREMPDAGWQVMILSDLASVGRQVNIATAVAVFMISSLMLLASNILQRRRRLAERIALQDSTKTELERQVAARTRDLTAANARLRTEIGERRRTETELRETQDGLVQAAKLAALGQMSAGLSHELNQPLAAIRSYSDNARAFLDRDDPSTAKSNLKGISELTERMGRIIKNLRTYARNEPAVVQPVPLATALEEAAALLAQRVAADGIDLRMELPGPEVDVIGGAVRLQQVFVNLISNAIDAMRDRPVRILTIGCRHGDGAVAVHIADTGPGFADDALPSIFDPFFSTKEVGEGMGLGLSITYGIVKQFGGEIEARNRADGGGAEVVVTLRRSGGGGAEGP